MVRRTKGAVAIVARKAVYGTKYASVNPAGAADLCTKLDKIFASILDEFILAESARYKRYVDKEVRLLKKTMWRRMSCVIREHTMKPRLAASKSKRKSWVGYIELAVGCRTIIAIWL